MQIASHTSKSKSCSNRSDYSKRSTSVEHVVMHYCDEGAVPSAARKLDVRHWILYKLDWSVTKHVFELVCLIDKDGNISNYYDPAYKDDSLRPFTNTLPGYHVDLDMIAQILVDKYQYSMPLDRKDSTITRYACMAHLRRKFVESLQADGRSAEIMNLISELYWIETDCCIHFLSEDARRRRSVPLLDEIWQKIKPIFDETREHASNLFIKAILYAVNEWEAVCRYVRNGKAEIDNNTAERMMKPICLGRKNYLFCGSEAAAKNTSLIYSIIETCKMNGLRPVKYIAEVLRKLIVGETDYALLLPVNIIK